MNGPQSDIDWPGKMPTLGTTFGHLSKLMLESQSGIPFTGAL